MTQGRPATAPRPPLSITPTCANTPCTPNGPMCAGGKGQASTSVAVSAALQLAVVVGCAQGLLLCVLAPRGLSAWGAAPGGPLFADAAAYLGARALAAPATLLMLVLQGCFR